MSSDAPKVHQLTAKQRTDAAMAAESAHLMTETANEMLNSGLWEGQREALQEMLVNTQKLEQCWLEIVGICDEFFAMEDLKFEAALAEYEEVMRENDENDNEFPYK